MVTGVTPSSRAISPIGVPSSSESTRIARRLARQQIESAPHRRMGDQTGFRIDRARRRHMPVRHRPHMDRGVPPVVAADVDQHTDQPGFLAGHAARNALGRARHAQKRLLDEVGGIIRAPGQAPRQPEQTLMMGVEQLGHAAGRVVARLVHRCRNRHSVCVRRHRLKV